MGANSEAERKEGTAKYKKQWREQPEERQRREQPSRETLNNK
jgi:hypothetical protein